MNPWPSASYSVLDRRKYLQPHPPYSSSIPHPNLPGLHTTQSATHDMEAQPPQPPYDPSPFQEVMTVFITALDKIDNHLTTRLNRMEAAFGGMAKVAAEALQVANTARQETKDGLERLHTGTLNAAKCTLASTEKIEMMLGDLSEDPDADRDAEHQSATVFGRLRQLERAVVELSESVSDPDAARPIIVRHEAGVNTISEKRAFVDTEVDAVSPDPVVDRVDASVQVNTPAHRPPSSVGHVISHAGASGGSQPKYIHFATPARVPLSPFAVQPLTAARRGRVTARTSSTSDISSTSNSKLPTPLRTISSPILIERIETPVSIQTASEGRASSVFEEQEILDTLGADDHDSASQGPPSPPPVASQTPPSALPQAPPAAAQPSSIASILNITPLPRRSLLTQNTTLGPSNSINSASPPSAPAPAASSQTASQSPPKTTVPIPRRTTSQLRPAATATAPPAEPSTSAASPRAAPASASVSTSTPASSSPTRIPQRVMVPLPRGYGRPHQESLSTVPQQSPTRRGRAFSLSSDSLSSLSSLSTPPQSQNQPQAQGVGGSQSQPARRTTTRGQASASSASVAESHSESVAPSQGRKRAKGAATSASARVKKEKSESTASARPAKRRKTTAADSLAIDIDDNDDLDYRPSNAASRGGKGGRGGVRGRGNGGGPSATRKSGVGPGPAPSTAVGTKRATGDVGANKGKTKKYEPPRVGTDCAWPGKIDGDDAYQREVRGSLAYRKRLHTPEIDDRMRKFVQCDNCEAWYHFGCVGMEVNDPRLEPDAEFVCPPCGSSDAIHEQRQGLRFQEAACARPDCERAGLAEETNEYFVERIIGRRPYDADLADGLKEPTRFLWLVKWDGWKADFASWQERGHLGDCARFIEEFEQAAEIEGRNLEQLDKVVVLNEGLAAGW